MSSTAAPSEEDPRVTRTRAEVHATVLRLLGTEGPGAVSHARIVEESSVSRATLYRHWPDRTTLLVDAIASEQPHLDPGEPTEDYWADVAAFLRTGAAAMSSSTSMPWLLALGVQGETDPEYRVILERLFEMHDTPLDPLHRRGVAEGHVRPDLPTDVFEAMCFGTLFALRFLWRRDLTDELVDDVVAGLVDGCRRR